MDGEAEAAVVTVATVATVVVAVAVAPSTSTAPPARRTSAMPSSKEYLLTLSFSDTEKKVNQGWGAEEGNAELKAETAGETDAQVEAGATATAEEAGWGAPAATDDAWAAPVETTPAADAAADEKPEGRPRREREPEEEDNTLTLEEYQKQQKEKELELVPKLEARKANEGDDSIWKDAVVVSKKDEEDTAYFVGKVCPDDMIAMHTYIDRYAIEQVRTQVAH